MSCLGDIRQFVVMLEIFGVGPGHTHPADEITSGDFSGTYTFNDAGADIDFRVGGGTDTHLLFVDGSSDKVGIASGATSGPGSVSLNIGGAGRLTSGLKVNTGLGSTEADSVNISSGQVVVDATNNSYVGLNIFPLHRLHVSGDIRCELGDTIGFTVGAVGSAGLGVNGSKSLLFKAGDDVDVAQIAADGSFRIGTSLPEMRLQCGEGHAGRSSLGGVPNANTGMMSSVVDGDTVAWRLFVDDIGGNQYYHRAQMFLTAPLDSDPASNTPQWGLSYGYGSGAGGAAPFNIWTAGNSKQFQIDHDGTTHIYRSNLDMHAQLISDVLDPVSAQDAMTLAYFEGHLGPDLLSLASLDTGDILQYTSGVGWGNFLPTEIGIMESFDVDNDLAGPFTVSHGDKIVIKQSENISIGLVLADSDTTKEFTIGHGLSGVVADTYAVPSQLVVNAYGHIQSVTEGVQQVLPDSDNPDLGVTVDNMLIKDGGLADAVDNTKIALFDISGLTTATSRTLAVQDQDGTIALISDVIPRDLVNGTFVESFNALVTSAAGTITMSLEQSGGGDLTMQFSDGDTTLDCTPAATITLTAGSDASPQSNYIYVLQSTKVLTKSTSGWPATEHIKVGYFFVPSSAYVASDGCYINQNWNDHISGTDNMGHIAHIAERSRRDGAYYASGIDGNGTDGYLTPTASNVELKATAGVIYQMHKHTVPAFDTSTGGDVHVVNWSGDSYHSITNLFDITADSTGTTIGNNKYFNLFVWGVANKTGEYAPMMINLPSGFYNGQSSAEQDVSGYTSTSIPVEFRTESSTGFPVAIITIQMGATWVVTQTQDVRLGVGAGGGGSTTAVTDFADNNFTIFDESDVTKVLQFQASGITTGTTRTMTVPDANGTIELEGHTHVQEDLDKPIYPVRPPLIADRWYGIGLGGVDDYREGTNVTLTANQLVIFPVWLSSSDTFDEFGLDIATGQASAGGHIGIWNMGSNGLPSTNVFKSAELDFSSTGLQSDSVSTYTPAADGWYWLGLSNETAGVVADFAHTASRIGGWFGWSSMTAGQEYQAVEYDIVYATEPCPDLSAVTPANGDYREGDVPVFAIRKQ